MSCGSSVMVRSSISSTLVYSDKALLHAHTAIKLDNSMLTFYSISKQPMRFMFLDVNRSTCLSMKFQLEMYGNCSLTIRNRKLPVSFSAYVSGTHTWKLENELHKDQIVVQIFKQKSVMGCTQLIDLTDQVLSSMTLFRLQMVT